MSNPNKITSCKFGFPIAVHNIITRKTVSKNTRNLATRNREHSPKWIFNSREGVGKNAIAKYLQTTEYSSDPVKTFELIYVRRCKEMLDTAESVLTNRLNPDLCVQKLLVTSIALP